MTYKDYYQVLGVPRDAEPKAINRAYRKLARKYHPDVSKAPDAEARFKELGEAYEVLKDPDKRRLYDKWGPHWKAISEGRQPPGGRPRSSEVRFDFGDFDFGQSTDDLHSVFETVFGGARPRPGRRSRRPPPPRGRDQETVMDLPVPFAFRGGPRDIQFRDGATGRARRLTVNVPAGVRDGQRIRLAGQASGGKGDLFLVVRLAADGRFRLEGDDVHTHLEISPSEAVLGTTAPLETLDGRVKLKVPPGSSTGRQIRLRNHGYPDKNGRRGDLYAEIRVAVPSDPSDEERALYQRLAEISRFDPRGHE
ncbi:MAG TPA: DnaJ C-terminal domain-containing protein [Sandaracinaceae bacterium LLY-WYZ-13_1]|nr:DnaJ C-terminal domain-containing protein [Sandaracinaceae bacterium LLY-WYZ-13_1]